MLRQRRTITLASETRQWLRYDGTVIKYGPVLTSSTTHSATIEPCPRCGAPVTGGAEGCFALFNEVLAREYGDPAYGAVNLLNADAYVLQHPEDHGIKNNAFHLIRLCWLLEHGGAPRLDQRLARLQK